MESLEKLAHDAYDNLMLKKKKKSKQPPSRIREFKEKKGIQDLQLDGS